MMDRGGVSPATAARSFFGRDAELAEFERGIEDMLAGHGRVFLVAGDAGIGKTRLADQVSSIAKTHGARIFWGRCWESGGAPVYWPWVQALRSYITSRDSAALAQELGVGASDIATLLPDLRARLPELPPLTEFDPESARFRLFDALTVWLKQIAASGPLVLVLDDLHAADLPSLLLLRFAAREIRDAALMIIGTYRELEAARNPAVAQVMAEVSREAARVSLGGLSREDVASYVRASVATQPVESLIDSLYDATDGNPLFLSESLRVLASDTRRGVPTAIRIPDEVSVALRQRIEPLDPTLRSLLSYAAVIGREFDLRVLERVAERQDLGNDTMRWLDVAQSAGMIEPLGDQIGRYRFLHALIRDTLYEALPVAARAAAHRLVGEALEDRYQGNAAPHLAELAHHFFRAAADGDVMKAIEYAKRAGDRATALLAYEEAVEHYDRALHVIDRLADERSLTAHERCDLLLALGEAQWGAGDLEGARATFFRAVEGARGLQGEEGAYLFALSAIGFGGRQQRAHLVFDPEVVALLEEALAKLNNKASGLRARLMARLAYALYSQAGSHDRRQLLCRDAVAMARKVGDVTTLRWVLNDWRWALWEPDSISERLNIADELVLLAEQSQDREMALSEHAWRFVDYLELANIAAVDAEISTFVRGAHELRRPWFLWYVGRFGACQAMLEGRFDDAERLVGEGLAAAQRVSHNDAMLIYGTLILALRMEQGRTAELEAGVQSFVTQYPSVPIWRYFLGFLHSQLGRKAETQLEFERVAHSNFADLPRDYSRLQVAVYLTESCTFLGDPVRASALYDLLLPYVSRAVVVGYGILCFGAVARYLGMLASVMGCWDDAERHFETAMQVNGRLRARPALARTKFEHARMLQRRLTTTPADGNDLQRAMLLAEGAVIGARDLGMHGLEVQAHELLDTLRGVKKPSLTPPPAERGSASAVRVAAFRCQGDYWAITFDGQSAQLKDLLGFAYIAYLLRHPGVEFHVFDLVHSDDAAGIGGDAIGSLGGDAGELLDGRAKSAYKQRLRDLRENLEEAESLNDLGRAAHARAEIDVLSQELARSIGLGGRDRRAASLAERARVNVTKRISIAMKRISEHVPSMGRYLDRAIKTGTFCSYAPDPDVTVAWELD